MAGFNRNEVADINRNARPTSAESANVVLDIDAADSVAFGVSMPLKEARPPEVTHC